MARSGSDTGSRACGPRLSVVDEMPATLCTNRNRMPKSQPGHLRVFTCHNPQRSCNTSRGYRPKVASGCAEVSTTNDAHTTTYNLRVVYKPGTGELLVDMSSRAPSSRAQVQEMSKDLIFQ